jgi:hypothetical protein
MQSNTITLIVAVVGVAGTLAGVFAGQWMTMWSQRKQWLRDQRRTEFREVMTALTAAVIELQYFYAAGAEPASPQAARSGVLTKKALCTIANRVFIAAEMKRLDIGIKYLKAMKDLRESRQELGTFGDQMDEVIDSIVAAATRF